MRLVWDFAGVLFDWSPTEFIKRELPRHAVSDEDADFWLREIFQGWGADWGEFDRGTVEAPALIRRIAARTGLGYDELLPLVEGIPRELRPAAGSVALLARMRDAGHSQFFLSNMPGPYADHLEAEHDFVGWFTDGVFSARVNAIKPEREIFEIAAARFGVAPAELLFFDDHAANVEAARAAGWQAEQFVGAAQMEALLRQHGLFA